MKGLILGTILGSALTAAVGGAADYLGGSSGSADYLGRSPQIQLYDYIRGRQALENIDAMRRMADQDRLDHQLDFLGRTPCK